METVDKEIIEYEIDSLTLNDDDILVLYVSDAALSDEASEQLNSLLEVLTDVTDRLVIVLPQSMVLETSSLDNIIDVLITLRATTIDEDIAEDIIIDQYI